MMIMKTEIDINHTMAMHLKMFPYIYFFSVIAIMPCRLDDLKETRH